MLSLETLLRHRTSGPRYTSYPPVPRWDPGGPNDALRSLVLGVSGPVALYVHVPFCRRQCAYCGCNMVVSRRREAGDRYLDALQVQLDTLGPLQVAWLHLGGGTPTWLDPAQLDRLFAMIKGRIPGAETSVEVDPEGVDTARLDALARGGVDRISVGVQSLDPGVIEAVDRAQSPRSVARVIEGARARGMEQVNVDLMYGLPRQTTETLIHTLDQVLVLRPDRLAVFGYAHVPWMKAHQQRLAELPDTRQRADMALAAHGRLLRAGYVSIGLDHYALPDDALARAQRGGRLDRSFMGYTPHARLPVVGIGPSAISAVSGAFVQQTTHLGRWWRAVHAGIDPVARSFTSTALDRARGEIIRRVLCDLRLDLDEARADGLDVDALCPGAWQRLEALQADGVVQLTPTRLQVTDDGRLLVRNVAMAFDPLVEGSGYSSTV
ncbi:MAG TPA: oxygen-independent coproporphyrinogen III oxidase [Deltaproteobacteria bacterium]|nr:oxygen-independent coproporphyrinogen III oxidase [Deltaproteobacteria bacterium]